MCIINKQAKQKRRDKKKIPHVFFLFSMAYNGRQILEITINRIVFFLKIFFQTDAFS